MPLWSSMPSMTSRASTIMPAHVASVGSPLAIAARSGSSRPTRSISIVIVVLRPPGRTMPSRPWRSVVVLTRRVFAPTASSALTCSANAPCIARTPIKGARADRGLLECAPCARPAGLPASGSEQLFLWDGWNLEPGHRLSQSRGDLREHFGLVEIRRRGHDRLGALQGVLGLEDARADEEPIDPELHHERRVRRRRDASGGEVDDRQPAESLTFDQELHRGSDLLRFVDELGVVEALQLANAGVDSASVPHGLDDVSSSGLTLGADHGRAFGDAPQRLAQVTTPAHEGNLERVLVDVILLVGRREHLGLVDVVDAKSLED